MIYGQILLDYSILDQVSMNNHTCAACVSLNSGNGQEINQSNK